MENVSERDKKLMNMLEVSGEFSRCTARTLVYMLSKKEGDSVDIERTMDLRQPEVSIATKELRKLGIITKKDVKHKGKGRPTHKYTLKKSKSEIKKTIEEMIEKKIEALEKNKQLLHETMIDT